MKLVMNEINEKKIKIIRENKEIVKKIWKETN